MIKWSLVAIVFLCLIGLFIGGCNVSEEPDNSNFSYLLEPNSFPSVPIKSLSQNPSFYVDKNIVIEGYFVHEEYIDRGRTYNLYKLVDNEGYYVFISGYCYEELRMYSEDKKYIAKGVFLAPESFESCKYSDALFSYVCDYLSEQHYRLDCSIPLI